MNFPDHLKYTKDHEWALIQGTQATVGITEHAASALGDIVFVELPTVGRTLKDHETFGVVESIKAVSDLYSPFAGKVTKINEAVVGEPSLLNSEAHGKAWLMQMELSDASAAGALMDAKAYTAYVQTLK